MCGEVELLPSFHLESAAPGAAPLLYVLQDKHYRINYSSTRCVRHTRCNDFHPRKGGKKKHSIRIIVRFNTSPRAIVKWFRVNNFVHCSANVLSNIGCIPTDNQNSNRLITLLHHKTRG